MFFLRKKIQAQITNKITSKKIIKRGVGRAFDFFQLLNKIMFNGTLKIPFFIDISWIYLKTFIALIVTIQ